MFYMHELKQRREKVFKPENTIQGLNESLKGGVVLVICQGFGFEGWPGVC